MRMKEVYLDNGATTMVAPEVTDAMGPFFTKHYGNASSTHSFGQEAFEALAKSRETIAKTIGAKPEEIIFTSGGTEACNLALKGIAFANRESGSHIITTKVEHKCILYSCKWLEKHGFRITYLNVDNEGFVNPEELANAIDGKALLVSIIHGNNEVGTIQDLRELGKICKEKSVAFHTDACQSYTKTELDVNKQNLAMASLNAHKIHGPKGVGVLYVRKGTKLDIWQHGGGQEFGVRAGTENIPGIVGFAAAAKIGMDPKHPKNIARLGDRLIEGVLNNIPESRLNGPRGEKRLCNNANFSFRAVEGEAIGGYLNQKMIASSTGSACSAKTLEPSYVLKAMGLTDEEANGSLRLTLSRFTTEEEIDYALEVLPEIIKKLRSFSPLSRLADFIAGKKK